VVIWEAASVLRAPPGSLFRQGDGWAAYVVVDGLAHVRPVTTGERNGTAVEIRSGLSEGERVVLFPPDTLMDQARVTARDAPP
jgi:HlyD family secretion protein